MNTLAFDTETTGQFDFKSSIDAPHQPRLIQLGLQVLDDNLKVQAEWSTYIKPDGWVVPKETADFHGITTETCAEFGIPIVEALKLFSTYLFLCNQYLCHNVAFDSKIIRRETTHLEIVDLLFRVPSFCTMQKLTPIVKAPYPSGKRGFKWPTLQEAHQHYFGEKFENAHDAMGDVRAMVNIYRAAKDHNPELFRGE